MSLTTDYLNYKTQDAQTLLCWLKEACDQTLLNISSLNDAQLNIPNLEILNPPVWELGHLTWFHEYWVNRQGMLSKPSHFPDADIWFNSSIINHSERWKFNLSYLDQLREYFMVVIQASQKLLLADSLTPEQAYFIELSIYHQDMHNEAFAYMCQTLQYHYPANQEFGKFKKFEQKDLSPYLEFPRQIIQIGSSKYDGFIFDNEKWMHPIALEGFLIARESVTNRQYLEFLEQNLSPQYCPVYWINNQGQWQQRVFDAWQKLALDEPVMHISYAQAQAYCQWKKQRLPTEAEMLCLLEAQPNTWNPSYLWEWTSSVFLPLTGFTPDPYADYSQPWFDGGFQVLKGYSQLTPLRMRRPQFRNFYQGKRADQFCGFRTCV